MENGARSPETPGYVEIFKRYPGYRRLFAARAISLLGDWFSLIALIAMLREVTGGNAEILGILFIVKMIPTTLFGPVAGVVADRFSRRTVMIAADLARFVVVLGYFLTPLFPSIAAPMVLVLAFLQTSASAFFEPARTAMLPNLVPPEALGPVNALGAALWSLTYTVGSGLGGLATWLLGWKIVLVLDALTFLISAWWLLGLEDHRPEKVEKKDTDIWQLLGVRDMVEGFRFIKGHPRITYTLFIKFGLMTGGAMTLVLTQFGEKLFTFNGRTDLAVGLFMTARAAGTGLGPIMARRIIAGDLESLRRSVISGFVIAAIFYMACGLIGNVWLVLVFVLIAHMGSSVVWVSSTIMLQKLTPDRYAGRVFSSELGLATLTAALSNGIMGSLIERGGLSVQAAPIYMGALFALAGILFLVIAARTRIGARFREESVIR